MSRREGRRLRHRQHREFPDFPIDIRVGSRSSPNSYLYLQVTGPNDAQRFEGLIRRCVANNPDDPILLIANGYQPWLEHVFEICIDNLWSDRQELIRESHYADTLRFPENTYRRLQKKLSLPWSFIVDYINVPDVYYWTFREQPPEHGDAPQVDSYRFRLGVWTCARGAYIHDRRIPVTMLFTQPTDVSHHIATELLFPFMYSDRDYSTDRSDEQYVSYIFLRLFDLLSDWENVIREFEGHLEAAERNSREGFAPVKFRARTMHHQIDRIYELLLYLQFHTRAVKKLVKLKPDDKDKDNQSNASGDNDDPIWSELDDLSDELDQANYELGALKERFDNLTDLEFSIENAKQSDDSRFLTAIATLFLPISYLASIWGITTFTQSPMEYLYAAIPVFVASAAFVVIFPIVLHRIQKALYPAEKQRLQLYSEDYTMLGSQLPDTANAPGAAGKSRVARRRSQPQRPQGGQRISSDKFPP